MMKGEIEKNVLYPCFCGINGKIEAGHGFIAHVDVYLNETMVCDFFIPDNGGEIVQKQWFFEKLEAITNYNKEIANRITQIESEIERLQKEKELKILIKP